VLCRRIALECRCRYYDPRAGDNMWDYFFEQPGSYRLGDSTGGGKSVRARHVVSPGAMCVTRSNRCCAGRIGASCAQWRYRYYADPGQYAISYTGATTFAAAVDSLCQPRTELACLPALCPAVLLMV